MGGASEVAREVGEADAHEHGLAIEKLLRGGGGHEFRGQGAEGGGRGHRGAPPPPPPPPPRPRVFSTHSSPARKTAPPRAAVREIQSASRRTLRDPSLH